MNNLAQRIRKYLPLTSMEQAFLRLSQQGTALRDVNLNDPALRTLFSFEETPTASSGWDGFQGIVYSMREDEPLPSHRFFLDHQNITANLHPRYMPPILHNHDFFELQYVLRGQITQVVDEIRVTLDAGDLCFIAPFAKHSPSTQNSDTLLVNLLVRTDALRTTFSNSLSEKDCISEFFLRILSGQTYQPILLFRTQRDPKVAHLILDMLDERDDIRPYTDKLLRSMMEQLFLFLLRDHMDQLDIGKSLRKHDDTILTILRYIQKHFTGITLAALAHHFNYSEAYLSYLIKAYTGSTFSQTVTELRLQQVAHRLETEDSPISEIMQDAGYSDKTHFYRTFRRRFLVTPAQYRQHARGTSSDTAG